ncbi:MAG: deoxyguanosinetriphosphate triphosphohydrolase [Dehalococcoidia bacterium]|nr:MAG: deoxyguanosinetriphosphate triphosphohydrolase [Dehalococcoidia bacterium]
MISRVNIRQFIEDRETHLSPYASRSSQSKGRQKDEDLCLTRTVFQRDRDRIIHSKSFRRLKHKTQVFLAPSGDHYVTRLTHTLEVSQLARTLARALNLNEDLTEAISLGHDLGHTPFGHVGEDVLNELYHKGFRHYEQSLRVVDLLENDGKGLNLTLEVRDGILNHSKSGEDIFGHNWTNTSTLEGDICKIADAIAYINHDIGDAVRAGIINENKLPESATIILGHSHRERVNNMICDIIENSWEICSFAGTAHKPTIRMGQRVTDAANSLRQFLFSNVYDTVSIQPEAMRAREVVSRLYSYFIRHNNELPTEYLLHGVELEESVVDYIAGMTDRYALQLAEKLDL